MSSVTVSSDLKRDAILQDTMRAFKNRILPVLMFARRFENVPLEGTNIVRVPYFALASGASTDFVANDGYNTSVSNSVTAKSVTVNKRKYRRMDLSSSDFNRIPYSAASELAVLEAEKLADDVLADIWTVVTAANFAGSTLAAMAASAFDFDDVMDLRQKCQEANWPATGRGLILDSAYWTNLHKDSRLGNQNYGSAGQVQQGQIAGTVGGFRPVEVPILPDNGAEKIVGAAVWPSAAMVAFAPIRPVPGLERIVEYRIVTDPDSGLSLEFRRFGDALKDTIYDVIECNYGYAVGESAALKRLTKP